MKTLSLSKPLSPDRKLGRRKARTRLAARCYSGDNSANGEDVAPADPSKSVMEASINKVDTLSIGQTMQAMQAKYPVIRNRSPLAIGIHKQVIKDRDEGWINRHIRTAMRNLTRKEGYISNIAAEDSRRFNLDGSDAGKVSDDHRTHAQKCLDEQNNQAPR